MSAKLSSNQQQPPQSSFPKWLKISLIIIGAIVTLPVILLMIVMTLAARVNG